MTNVEKCLQITEEIITICGEHQNRDDAIAQIENLLEERAQVITSLKGPYTTSEKLVGKELLERNAEMERLLQNLRISIQKDLSMLKQKRKTAVRYTNPYANTEEVDGTFYDKRQ